MNEAGIEVEMPPQSTVDELRAELETAKAELEQAKDPNTVVCSITIEINRVGELQATMTGNSGAANVWAAGALLTEWANRRWAHEQDEAIRLRSQLMLPANRRERKHPNDG